MSAEHLCARKHCTKAFIHVNFCNISVYLPRDSIISTFFFCLSFPEEIILHNRSVLLLKPRWLLILYITVVESTLGKQRISELTLLLQWCSILLWNSRACTGFVLFCHYNPFLDTEQKGPCWFCILVLKPSSSVAGDFLCFREISPGRGMLPMLHEKASEDKVMRFLEHGIAKSMGCHGPLPSYL